MRRLIYQVYLGARNNLYDTCVESVERYCEKYKIDHVVQRSPLLRIKPDVFVTNRSKESYEKHGGFLPIYEKENAFEYFKEYDQIAIVDADIFIADKAPNIFEHIDPNVDFAGVIEREMPLTEKYKEKIKNYSAMQYARLAKKVDFAPNNLGFEFFNMGLMVMNRSFSKYLNNQTPREFLMRSEFKDFIDGQGPWKWSTDQTMLNWWIRKEKMTLQRLPWNWNALYKGVVDEVLPEAHFIHFFLRDLLPNKGENVRSIVENL